MMTYIVDHNTPLFTAMKHNAGQKTDFLAIELVDGHIHLVFNLGKRTTELKDNYPSKTTLKNPKNTKELTT